MENNVKEDRKYLLTRIDYLEENRRFIQNALENILSLGNLHENMHLNNNSREILKKSKEHISLLIPFESTAFYLVDQEKSDFHMSLCDPAEFREAIDNEVGSLIEEGYFNWALREKRGITVETKDHSKRFFLHVISTSSRIRGMFVGLLPSQKIEVPDAAQSLLSITLLNTAHALEGLEFYSYLRNQNTILEKRVEERSRELLKSERKIQQLKTLESLGMLAGGVAHDLNNILAGLVSYPDLLLMKIPPDSSLRQPIETIKKSGEKAATIVQDLLSLARRGLSHSQVVNLNQIISEYLNSPEYEKLIHYHPGVQMDVHLEKDLFNVCGSPVHLSKMIMNLVSNAAEAMPQGGRVSISAENRYIDRPLEGYETIEEGNYVTLTVSDTGVGLATEDIERIFEPFYTKKVMGRSGTGLGMAVVWGTVKDHQGYMDIISKRGEGAVFTVYLPVTKEEVEKDAEGFTIDDYMGCGESILVIDDVEEQREIASEILEKLGYSVSSVASGEEAVEHMKHHSADLLVLDMIMDPGIDGLETFRRILSLHPGQKAVIASGFSDTERVSKARRLGAGTYIRKPYTIERIGMAVKRELSRVDYTN